MRRADRLLQIVQVLRRRSAPTTALQLAIELEVSPRTIYRDIVDLQASRVPVDGEAGVGYVLRPGYDLPPLMFSAEELDAIVLGVNMVIERGDAGLARAATDVLAKVRAVVPREASDEMWRAGLLVPHPLETGVGFGEFVPAIRQAVRQHRKLQIGYVDLKGRQSKRTIWPLGLYLYSYVTIVCTWCEARDDYRAFRSERIRSCELLAATFDPKNGALMRECVARFSQRRESRG
jgi:predicted DNA-binding transcriptional regulator YafY